MISRLLEFGSLQCNQRLGPKDLKALQLRKLKTLVRHACENVPLYRDLYSSAGVKPENIRTLEDLAQLPTVTKSQLRDAGEAALTEGVDLRSCRKIHTSGSTGVPFRIYVSPRESQTRSLIHFRSLRAAGFTWRDRLVVLGPEEPRRTRLHERLGFYRTDVIPAGLSADEQIRRLEAANPAIFWAYPHALQELQYNLQGRLSRIISPRLLIVSGAVLNETARREACSDLGLEMLNFYGCMEIGRLAAECAAGQGLHVNADHVILECLKDGQPVAPGERGAAVVTSLNAFTMPFIRYELGDYCSPLEAHGACPCGSLLPRISAPEGRADDAFRLPNGRVMGSLGFLYAIRRFPDIDQFRFIQDEPGRFLLQVASRHPWPDPQVAKLRTVMLELIAEPVELEIRFVDFIEAEGPKLKTFVCNVPGDRH